MSYPKWLFKGEDRRLAETPDDEKAMTKEGWSETPGKKVDNTEKPPEKPQGETPVERPDPRAKGEAAKK